MLENPGVIDLYGDQGILESQVVLLPCGISESSFDLLGLKVSTRVSSGTSESALWEFCLLGS